MGGGAKGGDYQVPIAPPVMPGGSPGGPGGGGLFPEPKVSYSPESGEPNLDSRGYISRYRAGNTRAYDDRISGVTARKIIARVEGDPAYAPMLAALGGDDNDLDWWEAAKEAYAETDRIQVMYAGVQQFEQIKAAREASAGQLAVWEKEGVDITPSMRRLAEMGANQQLFDAYKAGKKHDLAIMGQALELSKETGYDVSVMVSLLKGEASKEFNAKFDLFVNQKNAGEDFNARQKLAWSGPNGNGGIKAAINYIEGFMTASKDEQKSVEEKRFGAGRLWDTKQVTAWDHVPDQALDTYKRMLANAVVPIGEWSVNGDNRGKQALLDRLNGLWPVRFILENEHPQTGKKVWTGMARDWEGEPEAVKALAQPVRGPQATGLETIGFRWNPNNLAWEHPELILQRAQALAERATVPARAALGGISGASERPVDRGEEVLPEGLVEEHRTPTAPPVLKATGAFPGEPSIDPGLGPVPVRPGEATFSGMPGPPPMPAQAELQASQQRQQQGQSAMAGISEEEIAQAILAAQSWVQGEQQRQNPQSYQVSLPGKAEPVTQTFAGPPVQDFGGQAANIEMLQRLLPMFAGALNPQVVNDLRDRLAGIDQTSRPAFGQPVVQQPPPLTVGGVPGGQALSWPYQRPPVQQTYPVQGDRLREAFEWVVSNPQAWQMPGPQAPPTYGVQAQDQFARMAGPGWAPTQPASAAQVMPQQAYQSPAQVPGPAPMMVMMQPAPQPVGAVAAPAAGSYPVAQQYAEGVSPQAVGPKPKKFRKRKARSK